MRRVLLRYVADGSWPVAACVWSIRLIQVAETVQPTEDAGHPLVARQVLTVVVEVPPVAGRERARRVAHPHTRARGRHDRADPRR
jgi:hypothetical protein